MMTCVSDLQQFSALVSQYKKEHPKSDTNFLMMPGEISALCLDGAMFVSQSGGFLKILCDRGDYFAFYFYADRDETAFDVSDLLEKAGDKDILIDAVISEKRGMSIGFPLTNMISDCIIEEYKSYMRMVYGKELSSTEKPLAEGYTVETESFDYSEFMALWKKALDERSTPLPQKQELEELFALKRVFTLRSSDDRLSAVGILNVSGRQALIQHIAVDPADRRKGLAGYILQKLISSATENNIRILRLWVDRENLPAVTLYNRDGFEPDGLICKQFIFKRRTLS